MSTSPSFTFCTYWLVFPSEEPRWWNDGIGDAFFASAEVARAAIVVLRDAVAEERDNVLPPIRLERIETVPVTKEAMLALLNEGVGAIVRTYDIVGTIEVGTNGDGA